MPALTALLLRSRLLEQVRMPRLRLLTSTGEVFPAAHVGALRARFPHLGVAPMYGLTDCKRVSILPPEFLPGRKGSVGLPLPRAGVRVMAPDGREAAPGEAGELFVRGPHLMAGYWRDPEATARRYRVGQGGVRWLATGDRFRRDAQGFLHFLGRGETVLKLRGERVHPAEVEGALAALPGVAEAGVAALSGEEGGLVAFLGYGGGRAMEEAEAAMRCRELLPPAWRPDRIIGDAGFLPRTAHGKLDRAALNRRAEALFRGEGGEGEGK